jgi:CRISPR-associated protein Cas5d
MKSKPICLRVKGPFACFTRPEFHVERVSYPIITPEAARGILDAILMKPIEKPEGAKRHNKVGFRYVITRLGIVNKGMMFSILRNELGYSTHQAPEKATGYDIHAKGVRAQRHSLILSGGSDKSGNRKMLEYLIEAKMEVPFAENDGQHYSRTIIEKYYQMFLRRARKGQCFYQPFFGCREFSLAEWALEENPPTQIEGQPEREDFGVIFHKFDFSPVWKHWGDGRDALRPTAGWDELKNQPAPQNFHAVANHGWVKIEEGKR